MHAECIGGFRLLFCLERTVMVAFSAVPCIMRFYCHAGNTVL